MSLGRRQKSNIQPLIGIPSQRSANLDQLTVLRNTVSASPEPTRYVFLSRYLFSPRDFWRALAVAIDKAQAGAAPEGAAKLHALFAQTGGELLTRENEFSSLALSGGRPNERLLSALNPFEHATR